MSHAGQGELSDRSSKRCMACGSPSLESLSPAALCTLPPLTPTHLCCSPFVLGGMPPAIHSPLPFFPTLQLRSLALFCLRQLLNGFAHPGSSLSGPIHPMSLLFPVTHPSCSGSPAQGMTGEPQPAAGIRRHSRPLLRAPSLPLHSPPLPPTLLPFLRRLGPPDLPVHACPGSNKHTVPCREIPSSAILLALSLCYDAVLYPVLNNRSMEQYGAVDTPADRSPSPIESSSCTSAPMHFPALLSTGPLRPGRAGSSKSKLYLLKPEATLATLLGILPHHAPA